MLIHLLERLRALALTTIRALERCVVRLTRPAPSTSLVLGAAADLVRSRSELVAENALLRQQLIVQPETPLRWHRDGFRLFWRRWSGARRRPSSVAPDTIARIRRMARENRLWGAERIEGELLKLGIRISKRTTQGVVGVPVLGGLHHDYRWAA
jgi:hypothetical protein